jgi:SAM-dependent methyltransferase
MAEHNELYRNAVYYDIVFRRDVSEDVDFIEEAFRRYCGRATETAIDIACGPGYHARAFASRGKKAWGLDLRPEMTTLAREHSRAEGASVEWLTADMRTFDLPRCIDVAVCMFDGLDALSKNEDIVRHFRNVAGNLVEDGIYCLDFTPITACSLTNYGGFRYQRRQNGTEITIDWGINRPAFDPISALAEVEMEMRVRDGDSEYVIRDRATERVFTPMEIRLLVEMSGAFNVLGWFGRPSLDAPFDLSPSSNRMIVLLQRS